MTIPPEIIKRAEELHERAGKVYLSSIELPDKWRSKYVWCPQKLQPFLFRHHILLFFWMLLFKRRFDNWFVRGGVAESACVVPRCSVYWNGKKEDNRIENLIVLSWYDHEKFHRNGSKNRKRLSCTKCSRLHHAKGLCNMHYMQELRKPR